MTRLLITGIGGDLGQSMARVARDSFPEFTIIGADLHFENSASLFCDDLRILPPASDSSYVDALRALVENEKINLVLPATEHELRLFASLSVSELCDLNLLGFFPEVWAIGGDKQATADWLKAGDLPAPMTLPLSLFAPDDPTPPSMGGQFILKPRRSSGSRDVMLIKSFDAISPDIWREASEWVLQEWISDDQGEYTIAVSILNQNVQQHVQLRRRLSGDSTGYAEVVNIPAISELVVAITGRLMFPCAFNLQLRIRDGKPMIFEMNPRFSSTVLARHLLGFPDLSDWIAKSLSLPAPKPHDTQPGQKFMRYFSYMISSAC